MEEWRDVVGFEGIYQVSNLGHVKTVKTGRIKVQTSEKGSSRKFVLLWRNNKYKKAKVHRLVIIAFRGPAPKGMECCHNDGDASNNSIDNLRWDTTQNNQRDRVIHNTSNRGERCASAKLKEADVIRIRADTRKQAEIAADYGVGQNTISRIKNRTRWGHI